MKSLVHIVWALQIGTYKDDLEEHRRTVPIGAHVVVAVAKVVLFGLEIVVSVIGRVSTVVREVSRHVPHVRSAV